MGSAAAGFAAVEVRGRGGRQMPAGRKTHDADARRVQMPLVRARAHHADGPLHVAKLDRMVIPRPEPVFQHERGHPQGVQVIRRHAALEIHREALITAARRDDDRGHRPRGIRRHVDGQRGDIGGRVAQRSRRLAFPQRNRLRILQDGRSTLGERRARNRREQNSCKQSAHASDHHGLPFRERCILTHLQRL